MKTHDPKSMGYSKISSKREVYSDVILSQRTRKISSKQTNLICKASRQKRISKPKVNRSKKITEIIEIENRLEKQIQSKLVL